MTEIYDKVQTLALFPRMGTLYDPHMDDKVRILLYGHYRIAYLVNLSSSVRTVAAESLAQGVLVR